MRKILALNATLLSTLLFMTGCAAMPQMGGNSVGGCDPILFIREGVTTQTDISTRCGLPTLQQQTNTGTSWTYDPDAAVSATDMLADSCGGMTGVAYNLCVASMPAKLYMSINFDRNGVVTDYTARKEARQPAPRPAAQ